LITAKLKHLLTNRDEVRLQKFMRSSQYWSEEEVRAHQRVKLTKLLVHASERVPYYQKLFKELGAHPSDFSELETFKTFPVLTKSIIRENFEDLISTDASERGLIKNSTGGSTGEPLVFYQDRRFHAFADAARIRGWYEAPGFKAGETMGVIWGDMRDVGDDYSASQRIATVLRSGEVLLNAFNLSEERMYRFYRWLCLFSPKLLRGYVTALVDFAAFLERRGLALPTVKGVVLCAETVSPEVQRYLERVIGAPSYNTYGGRELSLIAFECGAKMGLHEVSENNLVELEPIETSHAENLCEIVVTNLNNYAMPFIRYKLGDLGVPSKKGECSCGRGLPLIERIVGRTTEVMRFADGTAIAGEMFIHLMKDIGLRQYQFVQQDENSVTLRMHRDEALDGTLVNRIREVYGPFLPSSVKLKIEPVECFNKTLTGKFRFVFSEIARDD